MTGTPEGVRKVVADAYLLCGDRLRAGGKPQEAAPIYERLLAASAAGHVRLAAFRGLILAQAERAVPRLVEALKGTDPQMQAVAVDVATEVPGAAATRALAGALGGLPPGARVRLLAALADRADPSAAPAVR